MKRAPCLPAGRLGNLGLLLCSIALTVGAAELLLRATGLVKIRDYTPPIYRRSANPEIGYELKPNIRVKAFRSTIVTNDSGFRSPPPVPTDRAGPPDPKKPAIVVLGDSIAFGYGVEDDETLPAQLQRLLPDHAVLNAAVPGYNIAQEVAAHEEKLTPLNPKALVLVFYWNDFDESTSWLDDEGILRSEDWKPSAMPTGRRARTCAPIDRGILSHIPGKCWLDLHSAFYRGVKEFVNTRSGREQRDAQRISETLSLSNGLEQMQRGTDADIPGAALRRYDEELRRLAENAPPKRLFVIWPDAASLHTVAREELKRIAERNGFAVLDLYERFGNAMETLRWDYLHPSPRSLREAAVVVYTALSGILPQP